MRKIIIAISLVVGFFAWCEATETTLNTTGSLPIGLYQKVDKAVIEKGDIVRACLPQGEALDIAKQRDYLPWGVKCNGVSPLLKEVVATEGDNVEVVLEGVMVNKKMIPDTAPLLSDGVGRPMPMASSSTVKKGEFWLISNYSNRSFDSRYFGAITAKEYIGTYKALLTWSK